VNGDGQVEEDDKIIGAKTNRVVDRAHHLVSGNSLKGFQAIL
jgi:hypothetical protein